MAILSLGQQFVSVFLRKLPRLKAPPWHHFVCSCKKWEASYCGKLSRVRERVPLAEREEMRREKVLETIVKTWVIQVNFHYSEYSSVHSLFSRTPPPFSPPPSLARGPCPLPCKFPAVTYVQLFTAACKMTLWRCYLAWAVSAKNHRHTYFLELCNNKLLKQYANLLVSNNSFIKICLMMLFGCWAIFPLPSFMMKVF